MAQKGDLFENDLITHGAADDKKITGLGIHEPKTDQLPDRGPDYFETRLLIKDHGKETLDDANARDPEWVDISELNGVYRIKNFNDTISVGAEGSKPFVFKASSVTIQLYNEDHVFDDLKKATIKTVNNNDAKFLSTPAGSNLDFTFRPAKIIGRFPEGEMTVEYPLANFTVNSITTDTKGSAKIKLDSLEKTFIETAANKVKDGRNWYFDRSVKFLSEELIKSVRREYSDDNEILPEGDQIAIAGIETPSDSSGVQDRSFSEYGRPYAGVSPNEFEQDGVTPSGLHKGEKRLVVTAAVKRNIFRSKLQTLVNIGSNIIKIKMNLTVGQLVTIKEGDVLTIGNATSADWENLNEEKVTVLEDVTWNGSTSIVDQNVRVTTLKKEHQAGEIIERWIMYLGCTRDIEAGEENYLISFDPDRDEYGNLTAAHTSGNNDMGYLKYPLRFLGLKQELAEFGIPEFTNLIGIGSVHSVPAKPNEDGNFLVWDINTFKASAGTDEKSANAIWNSPLHLALITELEASEGIYTGEMNFRSMQSVLTDTDMDIEESTDLPAASKFGAMGIGQFVQEFIDDGATASSRYLGFGYIASLNTNFLENERTLTLRVPAGEVLPGGGTSDAWGVPVVYKDNKEYLGATVFIIGTEENTDGVDEGVGETFSQTLRLFSSRITKCFRTSGTGLGLISYELVSPSEYNFYMRNTIVYIIPDTGKMYLKNTGENLFIPESQIANFSQIDNFDDITNLNNDDYEENVIINKKDELDSKKTIATLEKKNNLPVPLNKGYYNSLIQKKKLRVKSGDIISVNSDAISSSGVLAVPAQYTAHPFPNESYQYMQQGVGDLPPTAADSYYITTDRNGHIWSYPIIGLWVKYDNKNNSLFSVDGSRISDNGNVELLGFWHLGYSNSTFILSANIPRVQLAYGDVDNDNLLNLSFRTDDLVNTNIIPHCTVIHNIADNGVNLAQDDIRGSIDPVMTTRLQKIVGGTFGTATTNYNRVNGGLVTTGLPNPLIQFSIPYSQWSPGSTPFSSSFPLDMNTGAEPYNNTLVWRFINLRNPQADGSLFVSPFCRPVRLRHMHLTNSSNFDREVNVSYKKGDAQAGFTPDGALVEETIDQKASTVYFQGGSEELYNFQDTDSDVFFRYVDNELVSFKNYNQLFCIDRFSQNKTIGLIAGTGSTRANGGLLRGVSLNSGGSIKPVIIPLGYNSDSSSYYSLNVTPLGFEHKDFLLGQPSTVSFSEGSSQDNRFLSYYKIFFNTSPTRSNQALYPKVLYSKVFPMYWRYAQRKILEGVNDIQTGTNSYITLVSTNTDDFSMAGTVTTFTIFDGFIVKLYTITFNVGTNKTWTNLLDELKLAINRKYDINQTVVKADDATIPSTFNYNTDALQIYSTANVNRAITVQITTTSSQSILTDFSNTGTIGERPYGLITGEVYEGVSTDQAVIEAPDSPYEIGNSVVDSLAKWYMSREDQEVNGSPPNILADTYTPNYNSPYLNKEDNLYAIVNRNPLNLTLDKWNFVRFCINAQKNFLLDSNVDNQVYFSTINYGKSSESELYLLSEIKRFDGTNENSQLILKPPFNGYDWECHGLFNSVTSVISSLGIMKWKNKDAVNLYQMTNSDGTLNYLVDQTNLSENILAANHLGTWEFNAWADDNGGDFFDDGNNLYMIKGWVDNIESYTFNGSTHDSQRGIALRRHNLLSSDTDDRNKREAPVIFSIVRMLSTPYMASGSSSSAFFPNPLQTIRKFTFRVASETQDYYFINTFDNSMRKWNGLDFNNGSSVSTVASSNPTVEGDFGQYELMLKIDTPYEEIFGFSMGTRIHIAAKEFKGGREIIWKLSKSLAFHIAVADFEGLNVWGALSQFAELTNSVLSFDRFGFLHMEPRPVVASGTAYEFTFDKLENSNLIDITKKPPFKHIYNYAEIIPSKPVLQDPKVDLTVQSDITVINSNYETFVKGFNINTEEKSRTKARPQIRAYQKDYERKRILLICDDSQFNIDNPEGRGLYSRWKYAMINDLIELRISEDAPENQSYIILNRIPFNDSNNQPFIEEGDIVFVGDDGPYTIATNGIDVDNKKITFTSAVTGTSYDKGLPVKIVSSENEATIFHATGDGSSPTNYTYSPKTFFIEIGEWSFDDTALRNPTRLTEDVNAGDTTVSVEEIDNLADKGSIVINGDILYYDGKGNNSIINVENIVANYTKGTVVYPMPLTPLLNGVYNPDYDELNNLWRLGGRDEVGPTCLEEYHLFDPNEDSSPYFDGDPLAGGKPITALEFYWEGQKPIIYTEWPGVLDFGYNNTLDGDPITEPNYYGIRHRTFVSMAIDFKGFRFLDGDKIDIDLPGLKLEQQVHLKKTFSNYQSIERNGLRQYPVTNNRFFNNSTAQIHAQRLVQDFSDLGAEVIVNARIKDILSLDILKIARTVDPDMFNGMPNNQVIGYISNIKFGYRSKRATVTCLTQKL